MTIEQVVELWPIVVSLATVVGAAGAGRYALGVVVRRLDRLDASFVSTNQELSRISTTVAVQSATLAAHTEQDRVQFHNLESRLERLVP